MVERTIQHHARELAAVFYEQVRGAEKRGEKVQIKRGERVFLNIDPEAFGATFPTVKDYLSGKRHGRMERAFDGTVYHVDDGSTHWDTPGWLYWYEMARQQLVEMLARPDVHDNIKDAIVKALIEDREKQLKQTDPRLSPNITQRTTLETRH